MSSSQVLAATTLQGRLFGVSATSATNAWAVGDYVSPAGGDRTLILHWNGTAWSKVASPNPSALSGPLRGVTAISATDAWAVGSYTTAAGDDRTLILHWDGTAWSKVATPNPSARSNLLNGVSATSATGAWAVGKFCASACSSQKPVFDSLTLHWNGAAWSKVASPSPGTMANGLAGVSATSATSAWAVGDYSSAFVASRPLILHWNGTAWSKVAGPNPSGDFNLLSGVSATSRTNAWAVGNYSTETGGSRTLILHWNGTAWSEVASPDPGRNFNMLNGVSATSASGAWAAGGYCASGCTGLDPAFDTLILRWNGTAWSKVASPPNPASFESPLWGVSAASSTSAWAVGLGTQPGQEVTLILHWNGTTWSQG